MHLDFLGGDGGFWPENDEDFDGFTQQIVRRADHRNLDHVGYFRDNLLDFFRANSIAPGLEEVALSLNKKDKAVFIYSGEIARVQPAVPEERGRLDGVIPVASSNIFAPGYDLARIIGPGHNRSTIGLEHFQTR